MNFARALAALLVVFAAPVSASSFEYLHIEANEGDSSGGHVAVRFGEQVYHFQHRAGLVRLQRDSWKTFQHRYRTLGNRGIVVLQIEISRSTYATLLRAFQRRYVVEEGEAHLLEALERQTEVMQSLATGIRRGTPAEVWVRGAGFFERVADRRRLADHRALAALRERIVARQGLSFLAEHRRELQSQLQELRLTNPPIPAPRAARFPFVEPLFAQRVVDLATAGLAIDVLENPHRLRSRHLVAQSNRRLRETERTTLRAAADDLAESLSRLIGGRRPDWGYAFVLGAARLVAMERSLDEGRWVLLSAMPRDAELIPLDASRRAEIQEIFAEAKNDSEAALSSALRRDGFEEASWTELENAFTRLTELDRVQAQGDVLKVYSGSPLPAGEAPLVLDSFVSFTADQLTNALARAHSRRSSYERSVQAVHGYHLVLRNCVSEIFRTIDTAFAGVGDVSTVSRDRLGGYIDPTANLNFVPFISANHVRSSYSVTRETSLPSFRDYHIDLMEASEWRVLVGLRESNVWTSTLYRPGREDGAFVFFTDRTVLIRPALGAANVLLGGAKSVAGLGLMPIDRGEWLRSGLSGVLFSLPELLFVNLRKGSNHYVPPQMRPPASP